MTSFLQNSWISFPLLQAAETICVPLSEPLPGNLEMQLVIPKGTILSIPVNVVQSDPEIWGPDAHIFRPERWLDRKKECNRSHGRDIFAFSEGCVLDLDRTVVQSEVRIIFGQSSRMYWKSFRMRRN